MPCDPVFIQTRGVTVYDVQFSRDMLGLLGRQITAGKGSSYELLIEGAAKSEPLKH